MHGTCMGCSYCSIFHCTVLAVPYVVGVLVAVLIVAVVCPITLCVTLCVTIGRLWHREWCMYCMNGGYTSMTKKLNQRHATQRVTRTVPARAAPTTATVTSSQEAKPDNVPSQLPNPDQQQEPASLCTHALQEMVDYPPPPHQPQPFPPVWKNVTLSGSDIFLLHTVLNPLSYMYEYSFR